MPNALAVAVTGAGAVVMLVAMVMYSFSQGYTDTHNTKPYIVSKLVGY